MMAQPFSLAVGLSTEGLRVGGAAPIVAVDQFRDEHVQYFGTFPLETGSEFSIFHRFEIFGDDDARDVILRNNEILSPSDLIWCIVHSPSPRGGGSQNEFEAAIVTLEDSCLDHDVSNPDVAGRCFLSRNKLGGNAYIERHALMDAIPQIEARGYSHLLQIGMDGEDLIDGFPWDPGYLNVWALNPFDADTFRFAIQQ